MPRPCQHRLNALTTAPLPRPSRRAALPIAPRLALPASVLVAPLLCLLAAPSPADARQTGSAAPIAAPAQHAAAQRLRPQDAFAPPPMLAPSSARLPTGEPGPGHWQNRADYVIDAVLDAEQRSITSRTTITYTNNAPFPLSHVWLHLEQNLFSRNSKGARMTSPGARFGNRDSFEGGYVISEVLLWTITTPLTPSTDAGPRGEWQPIRTGPPATSRSVTVYDGQPIDLQVHDTLARLVPPVPVPAHGGVIEFEIRSTFKIPPYGSDRMGVFEAAKGPVFQIAQWFPAVVKLDDINGWNTLDYLGAGEFYTDFGQFDVRITVPADHVVVATGTLQNPADVLTETAANRVARAIANPGSDVILRDASEVGVASAWPQGKETLTWRYAANNVRTVAWASSAAFIWDARFLKDSGPIMPDGSRGGTLVQSAYPAEALPLWQQSTAMLAQAIEHYNKRWYTYPYPAAINVNGIVGGMEYPMIIFCANRSSERGLFGVTTHEIGHNWFPMLVNSDERRHAWMDEGFNTFINFYSNLERYPSDPPRRGDARDYAREWLERDAHEPALRPDFYQPGLLGRLAYAKPAVGLVLLREQILGPDRFDPAFRAYIQRWAFKNPTPTDFYRTMQDVTGEDLGWFFSGWFHSNRHMDHALRSVESTARGWQIAIDSLGDLPMPVAMDIDWLNSDGTRTTERRTLPVEIWATTWSWTALVPDRAGARIERVTLDPDAKFPDVDPSNNVWPRPTTP